MQKKEVSVYFFQFIKHRVFKLESELKALHQESKERLLEGDKSRPELAQEEQLQKALKEAKVVLRSCEPVPNPSQDDFVQVGSVVEFSFDNGLTKVLRVEGVGGFPDICSTRSTLGKKVLGAKIDAKFMVNKRNVTITKILLPLNNEGLS
jgi:transcription elongation GreA/GreB family factor